MWPAGFSWPREKAAREGGAEQRVREEHPGGRTLESREKGREKREIKKEKEGEPERGRQTEPAHRK